MNKVSRSLFIKTMFTGALALQLPFVFSCNNQEIKEFTVMVDDKLYQINTEDLRLVLDILLPDSEEGPGALAIKADIYFMWLVADNRVDIYRRTKLISGIKQISELAEKDFSKPMQKMSQPELEELIKIVSSTTWGEKTLSLAMTVCFEAMFANPVYGSNPDFIGWKWLNFNGGIPQPTKKNKYPEILSLTV